MTDKDTQSSFGEEQLEAEARRAEKIKEIREKYPDINFPSPVLEPLFYGRLKPTQVIKRKLVVDKDTGNQFDIVSDEYVLVHHEEVVHKLEQAIPAEFGKPDINVHIQCEGARVFIQADFPEMTQYAIQGSKVRPMVRLTNSINRKTHLFYEFGAIELVCTNGLVAYKPRSKTKFKHITTMMDQVALGEQMKEDLLDFSEQQKLWESWVNHTISNDRAFDVLEKIGFSETEADKVFKLPMMNHNNDTLERLSEKREINIWELNSAATQFATHEIKTDHRAVDIQTSIGHHLTIMKKG